MRLQKALILAALGGGPGSALAQQPAEAPPAAGQPAPARPAARPKSGARRVIQIEAMKVEGRVQKPEAFYILQRNELNFEGLEPKKSFIPLILKSVEKEPF